MEKLGTPNLLVLWLCAVDMRFSRRSCPLSIVELGKRVGALASQFIECVLVFHLAIHRRFRMFSGEVLLLHFQGLCTPLVYLANSDLTFPLAS